MKFLFTKEAVFERDLVDGHGDTPVTNQMVLTNQTPNVESLDVDFADGSGKIFKGTQLRLQPSPATAATRRASTRWRSAPPTASTSAARQRSR